MRYNHFRNIQFTSIASVLFAIAFCASNAQAGIYLEPYLGYSSTDYESSSSTNNNASGMGYGMKAGYSMLGLGFGLDYSAGTMKTDGTPKTEIKSTDIGVFVGYTLPILLKAQASYFFSTKAELDSDPKFTLTGSGMKIGAGYTGLPFVALNFDYFTNSYNKFKFGGTSGTLSPKAEIKGFIISVSLPFNL